MCKYFGGKIRIGNEICEKIKAYEIMHYGEPNKYYFEPFIGMAGVFRHMAKEDRICIGCDAHEDLMLMWRSIGEGWLPPDKISHETHANLKTKDPSDLRGFVGFGCSYFGRFFSGFTDTSRESYNQILSVSGIFTSRNVIFMERESVRSNTLVKGFSGFDHEVFWDTMRIWSKDNLVFISETEAPSDFTEIWRKDVGRNFYKTSGFFSEKTGRVEKLFCHNIVLRNGVL